MQLKSEDQAFSVKVVYNSRLSHHCNVSIMMSHDVLSLCGPLFNSREKTQWHRTSSRRCNIIFLQHHTAFNKETMWQEEEYIHLISIHAICIQNYTRSTHENQYCGFKWIFRISPQFSFNNNGARNFECFCVVVCKLNVFFCLHDANGPVKVMETLRSRCTSEILNMASVHETDAPTEFHSVCNWSWWEDQSSVWTSHRCHWGHVYLSFATCCPFDPQIWSKYHFQECWLFLLCLVKLF